MISGVIDTYGLTRALIIAVSGLLIRTQSYKVPPVIMNTVRCLAATAFGQT